MKRFAKVVSLVMVGTMLFSMPVSANSMGSPEAVYLESGSNIGDLNKTVAAIDEHKTISEYMADAITDIWAMDSVVPVAQGGKVILDGVKSNVTFPVQKPELSRVYSAKACAASVGGTVLNVVKIDTHVAFSTANVNFYMPGITGNENIHVLQYVESSDTWEDLNVTEIRADHVVVDLTSTGVFAFVVLP